MSIKRVGSLYVVVSEDGRRTFGAYRTAKKARARLYQIERFAAINSKPKRKFKKAKKAKKHGR